jgi:hypothetical protein
MVAEQRGISVEDFRVEKANDIVNTGNYLLGPSSLDIFDDDGEATWVDTDTLRCTCVAFSHRIKCTCVHVAGILLNKSETGTDNGHECHGNGHVSNNKPQPSVSDTVKHKIEEMYMWSLGDGLTECTNINEVLENVSKSHSVIFNSKYSKVSRKRKIEKLHPNRKSKQTRSGGSADHLYSTSGNKSGKKNKTVNADGSFKRSCRKKGAVRSSFK